MKRCAPLIDCPVRGKMRCAKIRGCDVAHTSMRFYPPTLGVGTAAELSPLALGMASTAHDRSIMRYTRRTMQAMRATM